MTNILSNSVTLLEASQEYKEALINQGFRIISIFIVGVKSAAITTPPTPATTEDFYIVPSGATGAWSGKATQIAMPAINSQNQPNGNWTFLVPVTGMQVYDAATATRVTFDGTAWI